MLRWLLLLASAARRREPLQVGSKRFTESYILGEIISPQPPAAGAQHRQPAWATPASCSSALKTGSIDLYPEYTGTIAQRDPQARRQCRRSRAEPRARAAGPGRRGAARLQQQLCAGDARRRARALGIAHPVGSGEASRRCKLGLSQEFIGRADGWPGLKARLRAAVRRARADSTTASPTRRSPRGQIDVIDIYTTDAKIDALRPARARRRSQLLPALRRGAAVPRSMCRSASRGLGGAAEARRAHRRDDDDPHERRAPSCEGARASREAARRCWRAAAIAGTPRPRRQRRFLEQAVRPRLLAPHAASTWCWCSSRSRRASLSACRSASLAAKVQR